MGLLCVGLGGSPPPLCASASLYQCIPGERGPGPSRCSSPSPVQPKPSVGSDYLETDPSHRTLVIFHRVCANVFARPRRFGSSEFISRIHRQSSLADFACLVGLLNGLAWFVRSMHPWGRKFFAGLYGFARGPLPSAAGFLFRCHELL
jgi:hypothetical protein